MYIGDQCGSGRLELTRFYDRILGMKMEVSFGDLMFQVVVLIIVCLQEIVSGEMAQGCVGSRLSLRCSEMKVINVTAVVLGDSYGVGSVCYITDNACTHNATADHTMDVHRRCDGQSNCTVDVIQETIPCGYLSSTNNDFERITYNCLERPRQRAQGCVGSRLSLRCSEMKIISIISVDLGDSDCFGSSCCIKDNDCSQNATANHVTDVHRGCDGQSSCNVDVIRGEMISCGYMGSSVVNDFERITYNCRDNPQRSTTATLPRPNPTEDNLFTEENTKRTETENVFVSSAIIGVGIVGAVCLIITIGIVFVVKVRRKRMKHLRSTEAAKTVYVETDEYETIDVNEAQGISIEKPVSEYCELDVVDRARVQIDSKYLQLYEPLVVCNQSP